MADVYRIGVRLAMTSNVTQMLGVMGKEFIGLNAKSEEFKGKLDRVRLALAGVLAIGAGAALAATFKEPIDKAMEFEQAVSRFRQFGLGDRLNNDAVNFAKNMNIAGTTYTQAMRNMTEAQGVFRESGLAGPAALAGAKLAAPILAKIDFANRMLDPDMGGSRHVASMDMMRFIEMKGGANDPRLFNSLANSGYKAITSSGGNVNWSLYRQFMATGGVAAQGLSSDALFGQMEPVIGELKSRAGTALMTAFNRLTGITRVPNQVAHDLVKSGLWDGSKITWNAQGGIKQINGSPLKDQATFGRSQFDWYMKYMMPYYQSKHMSDTDMNRMDAMVGGRTGGMMFSIFRRQAAPIMASLAAQQKAMGIDDSYGTAKGTTAGKFADAQAKFNNLMISYGTAILPLVNRALDHLLPMMQSLASWMERHSKVVKAAALGVAALSAGLIAAGAVALAVAAGPIALWTAGLAAVGAAVVAVSAYLGSLRSRLIELLNFIPGVHIGDGAKTSPYVPPSQGQWQVAVHNTFDKHGIATMVTHEQGRAASRPNTGIGTFNPTYAIPAVAGGR